MRQFAFHRAGTVQEAVRWLAKGNVRALAGGTDLVIALRDEAARPESVVDINGIPELRRVDVEAGRCLVGAAVTFAELAANPLFTGSLAAIGEAAASVGSPQIRNAGTLGGNIANGSPAADCVVPFVALEAEVTVASVRGARTVPLNEVFRARQGDTTLAPDELIVDVSFAMPAPGTRSAFAKLGRRNALSIARLSCAVFGRPEAGGVNVGVRVAVGAAAPHPFRMAAVEALLEGRPLGAQVLRDALDQSSLEIVRVLGKRASMPYKREAIKGVLWEALDRGLGPCPQL